jgi:hypothetical protein
MTTNPMILGRRTKALLAAFLIASFALSCAYGWHLHSKSLEVTLLDPDEAEALPASEHKAVWSVERLEKSKGRVFIKGWAIVPGGRFANVKSAFVLKDQEDGSFYQLRSYTYERLDVGQTYTPNHEDYLYNFDHDFCGISATADLGRLPQGRAFELYIRFDSGNAAELIDTGYSIGEGAK